MWTPDQRAVAAAGIAGNARRLATEWGHESGTVTAYESWASEPPTEALMDAFAADGWRVLVPITREDLTLSWRTRKDPTDLGPEALAGADLILVPALSIAADGTRLGQGGGCYDKALPSRAPGTPVAAIVWDDEVVAHVPHDSFDAKVDAIITPDRVVIPT